MQERQRRGAADVLLLDLVETCQSGQRTRGPRGHDVAAHAVDAEARAGRRDAQELALGQADAREALAGGGDARAELVLGRRPLAQERLGVALEGEAAPHDLRAHGGIRRARHLDAEAEAVEQLRAQLALLDVHRPDEQEARVVHGRHGVALDARDARGGRVEQRVHEVVGQQVDLVHVEDALVRAREQAGLEGLLAAERATQVERADEPVETRPERQLDERCRTLLDSAVRGDRAVGRELARRERERLPGGDRDARKQRREAAHGRRLGSSPLAAHEHAADLG